MTTTLTSEQLNQIDKAACEAASLIPAMTLQILDAEQRRTLYIAAIAEFVKLTTADEGDLIDSEWWMEANVMAYPTRAIAKINRLHRERVAALKAEVERLHECEGADATLREVEKLIPRNHAHRDYAETVNLALHHLRESAENATQSARQASARAEKAEADWGADVERWRGLMHKWESRALTAEAELAVLRSQPPDSREAFESTFPNLRKGQTPSGMYEDRTTQCVWEGWQAGVLHERQKHSDAATEKKVEFIKETVAQIEQPPLPTPPAGYHLATDEERKCLPKCTLLWDSVGCVWDSETVGEGDPAADGVIYACPDLPPAPIPCALPEVIDKLHIITGPNGMCLCGTEGKTCQDLLRVMSKDVEDAILIKNMGGERFPNQEQALDELRDQLNPEPFGIPQETLIAPMPCVQFEDGKLLPPPHGQWHRNDWTPDMLAGGWRPLLLGETSTGEDEWFYTIPIPFKWVKTRDHLGVVRQDSPYYRTRRPLPPAPEPEWVPLSAEDVPPGSVFRFQGSSTVWSSPVDVDQDAAVFYNGQDRFMRKDWLYLMNAGYEILRPNTTEWLPCKKLKQ